MLRDLRNLTRLAGIAWTLGRHDALFPLDVLRLPALVDWPIRYFSRTVRRKTTLRPGERLALALRELGPSFIKLGQTLSTRPDLVGEEVADDLSGLQDRLPPFPTVEAKATIAREFDKPLAQLFAEFDDEPVAAASIAQVHFAIARDIDADGVETQREVAVKILRPGIERAFARDLELFLWTAEWIERVQPALRRLKPVEVVATFARVVATEMDLRMEAAAASELAENFHGDDSFRVPAVDWRRTARRVLTLERIHGLPIDETAAMLDVGLDPNEVLTKASAAFFNQVFRDGFFHADLHPGNLSVGIDGAVQAVDFGIMGRLDIETRRFLGEMFIGFLDGDYRRVAEVHFRAGYVPADQPLEEFMQACRSIGEPILGLPLDEISIARLLGQLFQVTERFQMETQPQLLLLQKTMVSMEGIGRILNPRINMWRLARPQIEDWVIGNLGPQARLRDGARDMLASLERLPRTLANIEKVTALLAEGGVKLHPDTVSGFNGDKERGPRAMTAALWTIAALLVALLVALARH
ncbi:MAG TPA: 2-polyprenylphenol 6-hydroxylase [Alphaproteobacteria bacterium]|jgi:ubiquinone biosynthesis protein